MTCSVPKSYLALTALLLMAQAQAATPSDIPAELQRRADQQLIQQQQRQDAIEQAITPNSPDVRLAPVIAGSSDLNFPHELRCFHLHHIVLDGQDSLPGWLSLSRILRQAKGQCLGVKGINLLMSALQNRLVAQGFITSRVLAPQQNLSSGTLRLLLLAGKISNVQLTPGSSDYIWLYSSFPAHAGQLLDLRDIEQGLENLQRLPTVQAEMNIVPGDKPGESMISLTRKQSKFWRVNATFDDSGNRSTGRYQGGLTVSLDNPFALSDLFYISLNHDLQKGREKGTRNYTGHYSLPVGYWLFSVTGSDSNYHQTIAGLNGDYRYSGNSKTLDIQASRVLLRNASSKTSFSYDVISRQSSNAINQTEIAVQRRHTTAWRLGLQHQHYIGRSTLNASISYQQGNRWFGALPAPEEYVGDATALSKVVQMSLQFNQPFTLLGQNLRFSSNYQRQMTHDSLTPQDQFAIGGRWTVRGLDGERTLNASRGWYLRNELSIATPLPQQEFYLGVDYGEVGGVGRELLTGTHLAGGAIGLRGLLWSTNYDFFAGTPLSKPDGFLTSWLNLGFSLSWSF